MKYGNTIKSLALAITFALPLVTHAQTVTPPVVPPGLEVPEPNEAFLIGHAAGTQNYECQPSATILGRVAWTLFTPEATLFDDAGNQLTTHFFSPNPIEGSIVRATWQDSADTSTIWARATGSAVVKSTAVAWLRLEVVGSRVGPTGGDALSHSTFVQRVNTEGGVAPATGCDRLNDAGAKAFVPYTADYVFYRQN